MRVLVMGMVSPLSGQWVGLLCSDPMAGGRVVAFRAQGAVVAIPVRDHRVAAQLEAWSGGMVFLWECVVDADDPDLVDGARLAGWARGVFERVRGM